MYYSFTYNRALTTGDRAAERLLHLKALGVLVSRRLGNAHIQLDLVIGRMCCEIGHICAVSYMRVTGNVSETYTP